MQDRARIHIQAGAGGDGCLSFRREAHAASILDHPSAARVLGSGDDGGTPGDAVRVAEELLTTTRLPMAVSFLSSEIKAIGLMGPAMARIGHYFTRFQSHVVTQAETDVSRFSMDQALLVLEREATDTEIPAVPERSRQ